MLYSIAVPVLVFLIIVLVCIDIIRPPRTGRKSIVGGLVVLGLSLGLVLWLLISLSPRFTGNLEEARRRVAEAAIDCFKLELEMLELDTGRYPTQKEGLEALMHDTGTPGWRGPYMHKVRYNDPWGNPYIYRSPGPGDKSYELKSYGLDGKEGGGDDIVKGE